MILMIYIKPIYILKVLKQLGAKPGDLKKSVSHLKKQEIRNDLAKN